MRNGIARKSRAMVDRTGYLSLFVFHLPPTQDLKFFIISHMFIFHICIKFRFVHDLLTGDDSVFFTSIWKARIPHRIKVLLWLLENGVVLTKDNLLKRNWTGDPSCYCCFSNECIDHLFFLCPVAKVT